MKLSLKILLQSIGLIFMFLTISHRPQAQQLQASFLSAKKSACEDSSGNIFSFTNTTKNASVNAKYSWDFGNGKKSSNATTAGTTYFNAGKYPVTLTVTDGANTNSFTDTVIVFKTPSVDFTVDGQKGCAPFTVNFTATPTLGDAPIDRYFWSLGGTTQTSSTNTISYTYNFDQTYSITLTALDQNGCQSATKEIKNLITVFPKLTAGFTLDKKLLCSGGDSVIITNTTTGPDTLSYEWGLGDGSTSTDISLSHIYKDTGRFNIQLIVRSTVGCMQVYNDSVNVASYNSSFSIKSLPVCSNTPVSFIRNGDLAATTTKWYFSTDNFSTYTTGDSISKTFPASADSIKVRMISTFGTCVDTAKDQSFLVYNLPQISPFDVDKSILCGAPVNVTFKDTTSGLVKWLWDFGNGATDTTGKSVTSFYNKPGNYTVSVIGTDANGCTATTKKVITIGKPSVQVDYNFSSNILGLTGCEGLQIGFIPKNLNPTDSIVKVNWDFGDSTSSTLLNPTHTFNQQDTFRIKLTYETKNCKNQSDTIVTVYKKPKVDFTIRDTIICGSSRVYFLSDTSSKPDVTMWRYDFIKNKIIRDSTYADSIKHNFYDSGYYTIRMFAYNNSCKSDTITKVNFVYVKELFIDTLFTPVYTCDNTRGDVVFKQASRFADKWTWDMGDGTIKNFATNTRSFTYQYKKSGIFKVKLTIDGHIKCTVSDSLYATVLLKQNPIISTDKPNVCASNNLMVKINNLDTNYVAYTKGLGKYYGIYKWEYGDLTKFLGTQSQDSIKTIDSVLLGKLVRGKQNIRLILNSNNCKDTSNFATIFVKGPTAGSDIISNNCFKNPVLFKDTSKANNNVPIKSWYWNFGDGKNQTLTNTGNTTHIYTNPAVYYAQLKVTDAEGCTDTTAYKKITTAGPKANFTWSPSNVSPFDNVIFSNTSNIFGASNNTYTWSFTSNQQVSSTNTLNQTVNNIYPTVLTDTVKLIASNNDITCNDTIIKLVPVKIVTASFTYNLSYINPLKSCPPVLISLTSTSLKSLQIKWLFGDGDSAFNINPAGHQYEIPGIYRVTLIAYGANNVTDTAYQDIEITGPFGTVKSNIQPNCSHPSVLLTASSSNTQTYTWDFGDGTIISSLDSFINYTYRDTGYFKASLIMTDTSGCTNRYDVAEKILSDTLNFSIDQNPLFGCEKTNIYPTATILESVSSNYFPNSLKYTWNFGTGNPTDTSQNITPKFIYNNPGSYQLSLNIQSITGCNITQNKNILVKPIAKAAIIGPISICENTPYQYQTSSPIKDSINWKWVFFNGLSDTSKLPALQSFSANSTPESITLFTNYNGCIDSSNIKVFVHKNPKIDLLPKNNVLCFGQKTQLTANDGTNYSWLPNYQINKTNIANPIVQPLKDTTYYVVVTNQFGCSSKDSTFITVAPKFKLTVLKDTFTCPNIAVPLKVTGAFSYTWINNTFGLSNTQIATPTATPTNQGKNIYTVVGYDKYNCFTDTATLTVTLQPLPIKVFAGNDVSVAVGTNYTMQTVTSNDVIGFAWQPTTYLDCATCQFPVSTPRSNIQYVLTGKTQYGCERKDTMNISLKCVGNTLSIPSGFTPNNGDVINNKFYPLGKGIKTVNHFVIYNRFGSIIFEKRDFNVNDKNFGWDGTYKGENQPPGSYIYFIDATCDTGEKLTYQGTITLIR